MDRRFESLAAGVGERDAARSERTLERADERLADDWRDLAEAEVVLEAALERTRAGDVETAGVTGPNACVARERRRSARGTTRRTGTRRRSVWNSNAVERGR